ncbi:MAG: glycosyltransferase [Candidatus Electrothrix sp. AUS4]|nr:glycosyltransferase [Candidatus Electrothrix sp. AUS4]
MLQLVMPLLSFLWGINRYSGLHVKGNFSLKILHIIDSGGLYGAEVMLLNLAREQQLLGMQPVIGSIGECGIPDKGLEIAAKRAGIPVKIFRMKPGLSIQGIREVLSYCHANGFHLMHCHGYKGNIFFGFLPKRIRKIPIITTLHGWTSIPGFSKIYIYEWLDARSLQFFDAVVLVNKNMLHHPRLPKISQKKIFVVNNGIPEQQDINMVLDQELVDFCKEGFILGSVGRYSREKGFDILLKALQAFCNRGLNVKLLLIGEGSLRARLTELAATLGIEKNVLFTGYRDRAEAYMHLMNVYVISSFTEGLPITLLEAMKAKIPIVATTVGGIPDVLEHEKDALLVPPQAIDKLVYAIDLTRRNPQEAANRADLAYKKFIHKYSSRTMSLSYNAVYHQLDLSVNAARSHT